MPTHTPIHLSPDATPGGGAAAPDPDAGRRVRDADQPRGPGAQEAARDKLGDNASNLGAPSPGAGTRPVPGDNDPGTGQLPGTAGKMVGGGLEAGSTDFGPATAPTVGGRSGFGSDAGRSVTAGPASGGAETAGAGGPTDPDPDSGSAAPLAGAGGNSVTATGRPLRGDDRGAIGAEALPSGHRGPGAPDPSVVRDPLPYEIGRQTRSAGGPTGTGTLGGGTAGTATDAQRDRPADVIEGRAPGAEIAGTLPGGGERGLKSAAENTPRTDQDITNAPAKPGTPGHMTEGR